MESFDLGCSGHCLGIHTVDDLCRFYVLALPYREVQETVRLVSRWLVKDDVYYRADGGLYSSSPLVVLHRMRYYCAQYSHM